MMASVSSIQEQLSKTGNRNKGLSRKFKKADSSEVQVKGEAITENELVTRCILHNEK